MTTYFVRSVKLCDLLIASGSSESDSAVQLQIDASNDGLPEKLGCSVFGSRIIFAGGCIPPDRAIGSDPNPTWLRDVYVFETTAPGNGVTKMDDVALVGAKQFPVLVEIGGKLYAITYKNVCYSPSFEVFDPATGAWSALPQPIFCQTGNPYYGFMSYAVAGTKIFLSLAMSKSPVFCFDVSRPHRKWRTVPSMCQGGSFPFDDAALVLDLDNANQKLMFTYTRHPLRLDAYVLSLEEKRESITKIADVKLPMPDELVYPSKCYIRHIGGNKACIAVPFMITREDDSRCEDFFAGNTKMRGVVIPFQFDLDIAKMDKDVKNCLALQFMPLHITEFCSSPSISPISGSVGCFVL